MEGGRCSETASKRMMKELFGCHCLLSLSRAMNSRYAYSNILSSPIRRNMTMSMRNRRFVFLSFLLILIFLFSSLQQRYPFIPLFLFFLLLLLHLTPLLSSNSHTIYPSMKNLSGVSDEFRVLLHPSLPFIVNRQADFPPLPPANNLQFLGEFD